MPSTRADGSEPSKRTPEKINFFPDLKNETELSEIPKLHVIIALLDEFAIVLIVVALILYYLYYLS